ncbi:MAG: phosphate ABC transporter permease subunit PstC, partial [Proteobacteria bacterium]|nr:phosphate ABC transporter permease subunit PstC [Pseudomonadota bacterium]
MTQQSLRQVGSMSLSLRRLLPELLLAGTVGLAGLVVLVIGVAVGWVLFDGAALAIKTFGPSFLSAMEWDPEPSRQRFGALTFLYGTVVTSAIALAIAVPLGVAVAIFLSELCPRRLRGFGAILIEMLAAIPSVVYGFWGLLVLAPWMQGILQWCSVPNQGGVGLWTAGVVLAVMVLPYIATLSFDMIRAVPRGQRDGALALGATRWQMIRNVLLPYARSGIIGSSFLALGRALGETMAVTMLIGNRSEIGSSIFGPGNSIASVIANEFPEASSDLHTSALFYLSVLLLVMSVVINSCARLVLRRGVQRMPSTGADDLGISVSGGIGGPEAAAREFFVLERTEQAHRSSRRWDRFASLSLGGCFVVTVTPLFLILGYLIAQG